MAHLVLERLCWSEASALSGACHQKTQIHSTAKTCSPRQLVPLRTRSNIHNITEMMRLDLCTFGVRKCPCSGVPTVFINGPDIYSSVPGQSEAALRLAFTEIRDQLSHDSKVGVIFIDEIDALCPKRAASNRSVTWLALPHKSLFCVLR